MLRHFATEKRIDAARTARYFPAPHENSVQPQQLRQRRCTALLLLPPASVVVIFPTEFRATLVSHGDRGFFIFFHTFALGHLSA